MLTDRNKEFSTFALSFMMMLVILVFTPGCGGPEEETAVETAETGAGEPVITDYNALTLAPGATLLDGREVSLAGLRVLTYVADSAFVVAQAGEAVTPSAGSDAAGGQDNTLQQDAEMPGGPIADDPNTRLLVIYRPDDQGNTAGQMASPQTTPEPATGQDTTDMTGGVAGGAYMGLPQEDQLVNIHGWVEVLDAEALQEQYTIDTETFGYEGDVVLVLADQIISSGQR